MLLVNDGALFVCGSNKYGQLGFSKRSVGQKAEEEDVFDSDDDILPPQLKKKLFELEQLQDVDQPTQLLIYHGKLSF